MALRDGYSGFKFFEMFPAAQWNHADIPFVPPQEQSSYSVDTRGYETVTFLVNVGSCDVNGPTSAMVMALMHAHSYTAASYDAVSTSDLMGSDIQIGTLLVSFGGSMALTNGVIFNFSVGAVSTVDGQSQWVIGYKGNRRYLKWMLRHSGTMNTGSMNMAAIAILGQPVEWPVNDPNP